MSSLAVAAPKSELNISYVKSPFNLQLIVMKERGILENRLAAKGVKVNWHDLNSGALQAQALAGGSLDVAGVMNSTSIIIANSQGNPVKVVAAVSRPTDVFAIVVPGNGVKSVRELKGKVIAGPKGTVLHQLLVSALVKNGMKISDVQFVHMGIPEAAAAMRSGAADAALLAANFVMKGIDAGDRVLVTASGYVVPKLMMATSDAFMKKYPSLLKEVLAAQREAYDWINTHRDEAIALGAKVQGVSVSQAQTLYAWSHLTDRFTPADIKSMEEDMTFLLENDMIRKKVDVKRLFAPSSF
ncbi:MAG TPA: aliphatic sulfonate ABC transporter [Sutterella sp.]|nr:aliphatic sulfonate ABC transporter [Sutterella sp.]